MPRRAKNAKPTEGVAGETAPQSLALRREEAKAVGKAFDGTPDRTREVLQKKHDALGGRSIAEQMELVLVNAMQGMEDRAREGLGYSDLAVLKVIAPYIMGDAAKEPVKEDDTNYVALMMQVTDASEDKAVRKYVRNLLQDKGPANGQGETKP